MFTSRQLRQKFLDFMASKGHTILPSAPLVPKEDPTVLFNTAGMQAIVPYLMGEEHPGGKRLANSQKCLRTDDIEEVGDNRHVTFFEMLGNWSLGDYFKPEAVEWSFEFLTSPQWLGLDPKRIFVTVYKGNGGDVGADEEAVLYWQQQFQKAGIYADVGDEFDFKGAKALRDGKRTRVFFASTNTAKITFFKKQAQKLNLEVWTLADLDYQILEPDEDGHSTGENAQLKAKYYWENLQMKMPVITQDAGREFLGVEEDENPGKDIKALVKAKMGNDEPQTMIQFYQELAQKYGGQIEQISQNSYCLFDGQNYYCEAGETREFLTDDLQEPVLEGHPLASLSKISGKNGQLKHYNLCSEEEVLEHEKPFVQALERLLKKLAQADTQPELSNNPDKYIYRIRKMSGKDNWWGLPYRGPCGPCSEMYYLLSNNPTDFEETILPGLSLEEAEEFIENQIVEIGNNVFMQYEGEKTEYKEPVNLTPLAQKNIDVGLGFERFLMAINGLETVYQTDLLAPLVDIVQKHSTKNPN